MAGIKRNPADDSFSKCVRERANWMCERCSKKYPENSSGLHCSHNFSRRHRTVRWHGDNALALCFACHQWFGGNPYESGRWLEKMLGETRLEMLIDAKNGKHKVPKAEEKDIAKHYREQLKIMQAKRKNGEMGRIEFESWQ